MEKQWPRDAVSMFNSVDFTDVRMPEDSHARYSAGLAPCGRLAGVFRETVNGLASSR